MAQARRSLAPLLAALLLGAIGCSYEPAGEGPSIDGAVIGGDPDAGEAGDAGTDAPTDAPPAEPETTLPVRPPALTNQPSRFELASSIAGSTFECSIDGGGALPCGSPFEPRLGDGTHALAVTAISPEGVRDRTPATATWTIDTVAPATTLAVAPPALDNSVRATFQFSSEVGSSFACAVDGAGFAPCESPFETAALADGDHRFEVRATDPAGNTEAPARRHTWTLDSGTPDTVIDGGPSAPTPATEASFRFSSPDAGAGATYACALDEAPAHDCTSPWTVTGLADGTHTVRIAVRDAAGNVDPTPATRTWRVDTTPPTVEITGGPSGATGDATPTFTFTRSDGPYRVTTECRLTGSGATDFEPCTRAYTAPTVPDGEARFVVRARDEAGLETTAERAFTVDTEAPVVEITAAPPALITTSEASLAFTVTGATSVECALDGVTWEACDGRYQVAVLTDGPHTLRVRARDAALNETVVRSGFNRDTLPPVVTFTAGPSGATSDDEPVFAFDIHDVGSRVTSRCQLDQLPVVMPCRPGFQAPPLADGEHTLTVTATDQAGHTGSASRTFTVDTRPLAVRFTSVPATTSDPRPTIGFTITGAPATIQCRADEEPWQPCTSPWTVPSPLTDGTHTVSVLLTERGHFLISTSARFVVDTTP